MKTIVINTSKEAKKTRLDVLFNAPFDHNSLIWYDRELTEITEMPCVIKQALINDTDTVDRDYNLIVLVDLYEFPQGNEVHAVNLYKALMTRYIGAMLVNKLHTEHNLLPAETAVYFADSAKHSKDLDLDLLADNPLEIEKKLKEEFKERIKKQELNDSDEDLVDETVTEETVDLPVLKRKPEERLVMSLFSWNEDIQKADFGWKLKVSISDEVFLDFYETFKDIAVSIEKSSETAAILDIALNHVKMILSVKSGQWETSAQAELPFMSDYYVTSHTCKFDRDNDQTLTEGFFNVFANIFMCVQKEKIPVSVENYSKDEIKELLINALNKYKYFSDEKNIQIDFEPIGSIFEKRASILKIYKDIALSKSKYKDLLPEEVADNIMQNSNSQKSEIASKISGMSKIDTEFYSLVKNILNNYDSEVVKTQNDLIVKNCFVNLWDWKDRTGNEDFVRIVDGVIKNEIVPQKQEAKESGSREMISFIKEEYEREHARIINDITDVEHRLSANKNILFETENLTIKYEDLMKKGRRYLISVLGAVFAVIASVLPFIYIQFYSTAENAVSTAMYLIFTAGFALLYCIASGIYISVINRKKLKLKAELEEIKKKSELDRKESIIALYKYYSGTIVEANCNYLLWNDILRREWKNAQKGVKRNNHIKRLDELSNDVKRFMTMLKIDFSKEDDLEYKNDNLVLEAEESFYSAANKKIYSILSERKDFSENEEGGERSK